MRCLTEGNGIRGTARLCDLSTNTVSKILRNVGISCEVAHYHHVFQTGLRDLQADELTSYVKSRERKCAGSGMFYTWIAIHPKTKLVAAWHTGRRGRKDGAEFLHKTRIACGDNVQITTDAYAAYRAEIPEVFGSKARHNIIRKGEFLKLRDVHTSFVERMNKTVRAGVSRFARRTECVSKSLDAHCAALALFFMYYNFCRIHRSLRVTPAMEAGVSDHVWSMEKLAEFV